MASNSRFHTQVADMRHLSEMFESYTQPHARGWTAAVKRGQERLERLVFPHLDWQRNRPGGSK
eukprot:4596897-Pleurochrysis_carterae.AAC.1